MLRDQILLVYQSGFIFQRKMIIAKPLWLSLFFKKNEVEWVQNGCWTWLASSLPIRKILGSQIIKGNLASKDSKEERLNQMIDLFSGMRLYQLSSVKKKIQPGIFKDLIGAIEY